MDATQEKAKQLALQLLELHVAHELAAFGQEQFEDWLKEELQFVFNEAEKITLKTVLPAKNVKQIIASEVVNREIPGAVAEIAGNASSKLFNSKHHQTTLLNDIISEKEIDAFADKSIEFIRKRPESLEALLDVPLYRDLISDLLFRAINRYIYDENVLSKSVPGVSSALKMSRKALHRAAPKLEGRVEESVRRYINSNLEFFVRESKVLLKTVMTDDELKESAMGLWDFVENKTMQELQSGIATDDLAEFVVLGYEFWLKFRKTPYFKGSYELIVDYLYKQYGSEPLATLFIDFGLTPERIVEVSRFITPTLLPKLTQKGIIEGIVRRRLNAFYSAQTTLELISENVAPT